ncbi:hypothetical protein Q3O60_05865 [Alkalimonas collagenimarina]|uniref:Uncharacterized protein n=1 Tax=Alkalimonas collagenimarina TaxID=400390 RepID=A0ABT9GXD2_9GAMM|nr:hypothetical protein [Alkalimonas collagenimarina]MDP4535706.1 hypothetical protein [Alkalimonas collagenimarina]
MNKLTPILLVVFALLAMPVWAKTILTKDNVERYLAMQPELMAFEERHPDNDSKDMVLESHCDWPRHYQSLKAQELDAGYIQGMEAIIKQYGFQPAEFLELSLKISWPLLEMSKPMLEMSHQMLEHLPDDMRAEQEAEMAQAMQVINLLEQCMTEADKKAAAGFQDQLIQQMMLHDEEGMDPEQLQQMMDMMQQN